MKVVASVVMSFSRIIMCLEDRAGSLKNEWYLIHSVNAISVPITFGTFNSTGEKKDEKLESIVSAWRRSRNISAPKKNITTLD